MKTLHGTRVLALMVFLGAFARITCAQETDYYNQIASQEYKQWKFTPESYYYSWYKEKLDLGLVTIKYDTPGLGIHDKGPAGIGIGGDNYVNEKWRQMYSLRLVAASESNVQATHTDDEREFWEEINIKDAAVYLDRSTDLPVIGAKTVTKTDRDEFGQRILDNLYNIRKLDNGKYDDMADDLSMEYDVIMEEVSIVGAAHEANSNRLRTLQECNNRLRKLDKKVVQVYNALKFSCEPWMKNLNDLNRKYRRRKAE